MQPMMRSRESVAAPAIAQCGAVAAYRLDLGTNRVQQLNRGVEVKGQTKGQRPYQLMCGARWHAAPPSALHLMPTILRFVFLKPSAMIQIIELSAWLGKRADTEARWPHDEGACMWHRSAQRYKRVGGVRAKQGTY